MSKKKNGPPGEDELIRRIQAIAGEPGEIVSHGIGDDTAVVMNPGSDFELLITTDMLVEEVHFTLAWSSPWQVGWKAVAASVSDIAAMGGRPSSMVISAGLKPKNREEISRQLVEGIASAARKYNVEIVGGDTVRSDKLVVNVAMTGYAAKGKALLRSGARAGDYIYVTGSCGDSAAGYEILKAKGKDGLNHAEKVLTDCHLAPNASLEAGLAAAASGAVTAMMDLSDGLATDLPRLAARSGCGARVNIDQIPASDELLSWGRASDRDPKSFAVSGGEDFNLLITADADGSDVLEAIMSAANIKITRIGVITNNRGELILTNNKDETAPWPDTGFKHF